MIASARLCAANTATALFLRVRFDGQAQAAVTVHAAVDQAYQDCEFVNGKLGFTLDELIAKAQRIFHPYKLEAKEVPWWSIYEIGQRLTDKFDDVPEAEVATRLPSVFIAGDACHTHSPKAGQGMNVSMQDAFNLGWKLAAKLQGWGSDALLPSYSEERRPIFWEVGEDFIARGIEKEGEFLARYSPERDAVEFEQAWREWSKKQ